MAASGSALAALVQSNVNSRMAAVKGISPLAQKNPSYFIEMCTAIGEGIISGGPVIQFTTNDTGMTAAPIIPGTGTGIGIITDPTFLVEDLYNRIYGYIVAEFGKTAHDSYPPGADNSGQFLLALCEGINDAIMSYYPTAWTLSSNHPIIYAGSGIISDGQFSGLSASAIQGAIQSGAGNFQGIFWPKICQAIGESYVALIEEHSTGMVTINGVCVPSSSQVCAIGASGSGIGTAT